ncbi:MAG TPA: hypothetical protein VGG40_13625 [Solirubrobacterales bacterium]
MALVLSLALVATAVAKGTEASLRVVGKSGRILTEQTLKTGTISVKTSPKATCFGGGTGGSGKAVKVRGATALGLLAQASLKTASLRPLLVTDAFDFGLGICGVGSSTVHGNASWYLKINHKGSPVSGDAAKLRPGDEVLWDLASSYPYPNELVLEVPDTTTSGTPFTAHVFSYDEKGKRKPVAGAKVTGASAPSAADGGVTVTVMGPTLLQATHGREIPSAKVCVAGQCPVNS